MTGHTTRRTTWRSGRNALAWSVFGLASVCGLRAQTAGNGAWQGAGEGYTTRLWQTQNGLPEQTVQAFAQTQDGFLWIGTTGGLLRFDGSRFVVFDRSNTPAFKENSVFNLLTGRNNTLWIATEGGGLLRYRGGSFRRFGPTDGLLDGFVRTVLEDRSGKVWIGTDNGLFLLDNAEAEHVTRIDGTPTVPAIAVHSLMQGNDGRVWVGGSRLVALEHGVAHDYRLVGQFSENRVKSILQTRDGTVWVGTVSGLQRLAPGGSSFTRYAGVQGTVRIAATIGKEGMVHDLHVVHEPDSDLSAAALDAVSKWRYQPYLLDGKPVEVHTLIQVTFTLGG